MKGSCIETVFDARLHVHPAAGGCWIRRWVWSSAGSGRWMLLHQKYFESCELFLVVCLQKSLRHAGREETQKWTDSDVARYPSKKDLFRKLARQYLNVWDWVGFGEGNVATKRLLHTFRRFLEISRSFGHLNCTSESYDVWDHVSNTGKPMQCLEAIDVGYIGDCFQWRHRHPWFLELEESIELRQKCGIDLCLGFIQACTIREKVIYPKLVCVWK